MDTEPTYCRAEYIPFTFAFYDDELGELFVEVRHRHSWTDAAKRGMLLAEQLGMCLNSIEVNGHDH